MEFALPTDSTEASGLNLLCRLWVARFDVEEEGRALAEKYVQNHVFLTFSVLNSCNTPPPLLFGEVKFEQHCLKFYLQIFHCANCPCFSQYIRKLNNLCHGLFILY